MVFYKCKLLLNYIQENHLLLVDPTVSELLGLP